MTRKPAPDPTARYQWRGPILLAGDRTSKRRPVESSAVLDTGFEGGVLLPAWLADELGPVGGAREPDRVATASGAHIEGERAFVHVALRPPGDGARAHWRTVDAFVTPVAQEVLLGARWLALAGGYVVVDGMRWDALAGGSTVSRPNPMPESVNADELRRQLATLPPLRIGMGLTHEDPAALSRIHARLRAQAPRRRPR